jgi:hypothetical protein
MRIDHDLEKNQGGKGSTADGFKIKGTVTISLELCFSGNSIYARSTTDCGIKAVPAYTAATRDPSSIAFGAVIGRGHGDQKAPAMTLPEYCVTWVKFFISAGSSVGEEITDTIKDGVMSLSELLLDKLAKRNPNEKTEDGGVLYAIHINTETTTKHGVNTPLYLLSNAHVESPAYLQRKGDYCELSVTTNKEYIGSSTLTNLLSIKYSVKPECLGKEHCN